MSATAALAPTNGHAAEIMEAVIAVGDLAKLTPEQRICRNCGEEQPVDNFYVRADGSNKPRPLCKKCHMVQTCDARRRRLPRPRTWQERFEARVQVNASGCWVWTGAKTTGGYGIIRVEGSVPGSTPVYTHRFSYERHVGSIPNGMEVDHLCRNRACLNPKHLEPVTRAENARRGVAARRSGAV